MIDYCTQYPEWMHIVNLCEYSLTDVGLVMLGTLFWVICYFAVIRGGFKNKFVEMPMFVAAGNIAWEFVWSWFEQTNMGLLYLWGYRVWFFMDILIFYLMLRYGYKQVSNAWLRKYWKPSFILITVFFIFFYYFFAKGGFDTPIGATSAYTLSVGISTLYIALFVQRSNEYHFSWTAAWSRAAGDIIITVFVLSYYQIGILAVMGAYVALLDLVYVYLVWRKKQGKPLTL
jgi:hypothetical protein